MIAAGVLAITVPQIAGVAITALVGWLLMLSGIMHLGLAWRSSTASSAVWEVLLGLVYGVTGFYLITRPGIGLASLTLALAIYLFLEAVIEFVLSFELRSVAGSGWLLFDGIVTLILAGMIWATWPSSSAWAIGTLVGVSMLFSGVSRLMLSIAVRSVVPA
jgi:uncharacterized membrane protein HdeD (DUF308 family)